MNKIRIALGFIVSPLIPGFIFGTIGIFTAGSLGFFWCVKFSAVAGYPVAFMLGVPLYFIYRRYRLTRFLVYVVTGLALGLVAFFVAVVPGLIVSLIGPAHANADLSVWYAATGIIWYLPVSAICGAVAAAFFWLVARPDLDPILLRSGE